MNHKKEIAAYCAAKIVDWDAKCQLALTCIGSRMTIPTWFRNEIEDRAREWAEDNKVELAEDFDAEEVVLWEE